MSTDLHALLPTDKTQTAKAEALVLLGFPMIEPILPKILEWMKDMNWPVAQVFQPLLAGIGIKLAQLIRDVFETEDDVWKYWVVTAVVRESPALASELRPELSRMAKNPTAGEQAEGVSELAREVLGLPGANSDA